MYNTKNKHAKSYIMHQLPLDASKPHSENQKLPESRFYLIQVPLKHVLKETLYTTWTTAADTVLTNEKCKIFFSLPEFSLMASPCRNPGKYNL